MASGDQPSAQPMTYANSKVPVVGSLVDYLDTSLEYLRQNTLSRADRLQIKASKAALSAPFMTFVCFFLGFVCNLKFEVVTLDEEALNYDLHIMLMSKDDNLYIDDIDISKVMWCIEASDVMVLLISCFLILHSSQVRSPLSEYLFLPWLGLALRGLFTRQAPTAAALLYTMAIVQGNVNPLFVTGFTFLFLLESRLWLEIARLVRARWERRDYTNMAEQARTQIETLWSNDDVQSVEVGNFVY